MAARLIQRTSRLLAASISLQHPFRSFPSEVVRLYQPVLSLQPRAALHASLLCRRADSLPDLSQTPVTQEDAEFYASLLATDEVDGLLNISSEQEMTGNRGAMILQQISRREIADQQELLHDKRFQALLKGVNNQIQYVHSGRLIGLLKILYTLGLDSQSRYLQSVETEIQWRLRKFTMVHLAILANLLIPLAQSKKKSSLLDELVKQVELRWTEIKETHTLVKLLYRLGFMSTSLMERLEDKVLEFAEHFTPEETQKIMTTLAAHNRRTLPVLRALSFHLTKYKFDLPPPVILNVTFAYAKLNFCQLPILQRMVADFMPKIQQLRSTDIAQFIRSVATLKFSHPPLCEATAQACLDLGDSFTTRQLCTITVSFAHLNFQPNQSEAFFSMVHERLSSDVDELPWRVVLDVVWSLCVLGHATAPCFQKVLVPQFYNQVLGDRSAISSRPCLRLLHVNATAQLESDDYHGPLLPDTVLHALLLKSQNNYLSKLQYDVRTLLMSVFPDACTFGVPTAYGWTLDGEVVLDLESEPLVLKDLAAPHSQQSEGTNPLPEGARRLAILIWDFFNYCFHTRNLLGQCVMKRRHLQSAGFLVVEVPFYDWQELTSEWQKQSYLKDQIKKAVAEEMAR